MSVTARALHSINALVLIDDASGMPLPVSISTFRSHNEAHVFTTWIAVKRLSPVLMDRAAFAEELRQFGLFAEWVESRRLDWSSLADPAALRAAVDEWEEPRNDAA